MLITTQAYNACCRLALDQRPARITILSAEERLCLFHRRGAVVLWERQDRCHARDRAGLFWPV